MRSDNGTREAKFPRSLLLPSTVTYRSSETQLLSPPCSAASGTLWGANPDKPDTFLFWKKNLRFRAVEGLGQVLGGRKKPEPWLLTPLLPRAQRLNSLGFASGT